jgi:hypothetical protein
MKKSIFIGLLALMMTACVACGAPDGGSDTPQGSVPPVADDGSTGGGNVDDGSTGDEETVYCVVQFDTDGAGTIAPVTVEKGGKLSAPTQPNKTTKENEYTFLGWFYGEKEWDFANDTVTDSITLVARWKLEERYTNPFLPKD